MISRRSFIATVAAGTAVGRLVVKRKPDAWWKNAPLRPATMEDLNKALREVYTQENFMRIDSEIIRWDGKRLYRP